MKKVTHIKSTVMPELEEYVGNMVYVRTNITKSIEVDPVFNTESEIWIYDEIEYTLGEWHKITKENLEIRIKILEDEIRNIIFNKDLSSHYE